MGEKNVKLSLCKDRACGKEAETVNVLAHISRNIRGSVMNTKIIFFLAFWILNKFYTVLRTYIDISRDTERYRLDHSFYNMPYEFKILHNF